MSHRMISVCIIAMHGAIHLNTSVSQQLGEAREFIWGICDTMFQTLTLELQCSLMTQSQHEEEEGNYRFRPADKTAGGSLDDSFS